ncbi:MAG: D-tyrosyl-tRNA(Tyr) deacylase [Butyricicoccus pullicaecorum]|nr:D-tyrosyl-tRNA(Tyr) deacylase [Butyricicoccus pullicaecorum]
MRALIQRVKHAAVTIDGVVQGQIERGALILLGICEGDVVQDADYLADKCTGLRIFTDENDKMNLSCADISGQLLIVSQFTLYGDCKKGKRPNFMRAARPEAAIPLYERFIAQCRASGLPVQTGVFGADMQVSLVNDGPVTIWMDTAEMRG